MKSSTSLSASASVAGSKSISGSKSVSTTKSVSSTRLWIFRGLTLVGAGMFVASWFMPWWQAWIVYLKTPAIYVRPWGAESFLPPEYASRIAGYEMPSFFAPLMWTYLVVSIAVLLYSLIARRRKVGIGNFRMFLPAFLVGLVGLSYIVCTVVALIVMQIRMSEFFGAQLFGSIYIGIDEGHKSYVDTGLLPGYYLAALTGPALVVLALMRGRIVGKTKIKVDQK